MTDDELNLGFRELNLGFREIVDQLKRRRNASRNDVIEECAELVEGLAPMTVDGDSLRPTTLDDAAAAIRQLMVPEAPDTDAQTCDG